MTLVGSIHNAGELELASISMLKNVNKLQNVDASLHFIAYKYPLTQVGMHYKSKHAAHLTMKKISVQQVILSRKFSK